MIIEQYSSFVHKFYEINHWYHRLKLILIVVDNDSRSLKGLEH